MSNLDRNIVGSPTAHETHVGGGKTSTKRGLVASRSMLGGELASHTTEANDSLNHDFLEAAIKDMEDDAHYWMAKKRNPALVNRLNHKFMHYNEKNTWKAAKQVTNYWQQRYELFQEMAFKPMTISRDEFKAGAGVKANDDETELDDDFIKVIEAGVGVALPRDSKGRHVCLIDRSRFETTGRKTHQFPRLARRRAIFFLLSCWLEDDDDEGAERAEYEPRVTLIIRVPEAATKSGDFDRVLVRSIGKDLFPVFPLSFDQIHVLCVSRSSLWMNTFLPLTLQSLTNFFFKLFGKTVDGDNRQPFVKVHVGKNANDLASQLQQHGFASESIPSTIGGTWTYEKDWLEWQYRHGRPNPALDSFLSDADKQTDQTKVHASSHRTNPLDLLGRVATEQVLCRDKKPASEPKNAPSNAKIEKSTGDHKFASVSIPSGPCEMQILTSDSSYTKNDETRCTKKPPPLRVRRRGKAPMTPEERKLRRREQNVVYSRRKREKQRSRFDTLTETVEHLRGENKGLKAESQRLEKLLAQAEKFVKVASHNFPADPTTAPTAYGSNRLDSLRFGSTTSFASAANVPGYLHPNASSIGPAITGLPGTGVGTRMDIDRPALPGVAASASSVNSLGGLSRGLAAQVSAFVDQERELLARRVVLNEYMRNQDSTRSASLHRRFDPSNPVHAQAASPSDSTGPTTSESLSNELSLSQILGLLGRSQR